MDKPSKKATALCELAGQESGCRTCAPGRTYVFGSGNPDAKVILVGEAPGFQEDKQGKPFVGRSGKLLDRLLDEAGLRREELYITNVVKCRPMKDPSRPAMPGNDRPPSPAEIEACLPVLVRQIEIIRPRVICTLGNTPTRTLLRTAQGITVLRGSFGSFNGIAVLPTFHPAAVLRNPGLRPAVLQDLCKIAKAVAK
jgi:DNA polymerase